MGLMISNGTHFVKVWENPQATSSDSFAAQTVSVDLSAYDVVMVTCALRAGYSQKKTEIIQRGYIGNVQIFSFGDKLPGAARQVTVNNGSIVFSDGYYYNWEEQQYVVDNAAAMPISVYGICF